MWVNVWGECEEGMKYVFIYIFTAEFKGVYRYVSMMKVLWVL